MCDRETVPEGIQRTRLRDSASPDHIAGLLQFYPLDTPPRMRFFPLSRDTSIGRSAECTIQLDDERASRHHVRIVATERGWEVSDCDSTNGVFIDGSRGCSVVLEGGEILRVGSTLFRFMARGLASSQRDLPLPTEGLIGGPSLERIRDLLDRAAESDIPVLLLGETGTGKELAAEHLHRAGPRKPRALVAVNCAALPDSMVESELFGHTRGAFTGATAPAVGLIRMADGGTLFLDEVGELPATTQTKLLRVLQTKVVRPVGSAESHAVDVRVVCATNRNLVDAIHSGCFRQDLYARIAGLTVWLPPLHERREDIPALAEHFCRELGETDRSISLEALEDLCCRSWPFNVRELQSAVRRGLLLAGDKPELDLEHFDSASPAESAPGHGSRSADHPSVGGPLPMSAPGVPMSAPGVPVSAPAGTPAGAPQPQDSLKALELREALLRHGGDAVRAAQELGISRSQLYRRAKRFGIQIAGFRG